MYKTKKENTVKPLYIKLTVVSNLLTIRSINIRLYPITRSHSIFSAIAIEKVERSVNKHTSISTVDTGIIFMVSTGCMADIESTVCTGPYRLFISITSYIIQPRWTCK